MSRLSQTRLSKISLTVDTPKMILIARLYSSRDETKDPQDLIDCVSATDRPWLYDIIIDFRRFESELSREYITHLTRKWHDLEQGRDRQKCLAFIVNDYSLKMQLTQMTDIMPPRLIRFFRSIDEAFDWIATCNSSSVSANA